MPKNKELSHQSIVEAAWLLARREGISSLTMARVAKAAGLTRQAIYWHFKSRTAMLLEICDYQDRLMAGSETMFHGVAGASAFDSLVTMMQAWLRALPKAAPLLLALNAESLVDDDAREALKIRMSALRDVIETVYVSRIQAAGMLKADVDTREISDFIMIVGSPAMWHQLVAVLGWDHQRYTDFVIQRVLDLLLQPDSPIGIGVP